MVLNFLVIFILEATSIKVQLQAKALAKLYNSASGKRMLKAHCGTVPEYNDFT